jgi:hypothetical protein
MTAWGRWLRRNLFRQAASGATRGEAGAGFLR